MEEIVIKLLEEKDTFKLYEFELKNKEYFEKTCMPRGTEYYDINNFKTIIKEIVDEQDQGLVYMYLIKDGQDNIIGRINLVSVVRGYINKADLGYRIAEEYSGNGYASLAVKLILDEAKIKHNLNNIEAGTSKENVISQKVLIKNGFKFVNCEKDYICLQGKWHDSMNFEKIL